MVRPQTARTRGLSWAPARRVFRPFLLISRRLGGVPSVDRRALREPRPTRLTVAPYQKRASRARQRSMVLNRLSTVLAPRPLGAGGVPGRPPTVLLAPRARIGQKWGAVGK